MPVLVSSYKLPRGDRIRANAFVREGLRRPGREILDRPLVGLLEQSTTARIYPYGSPGGLNESDF
jgi:hypothetical protein